MKQIDLEPDAYRESGKAKLVRSILHKPVFMTLSAIFGVWVALALGSASVSGGFLRVPEWVVWAFYPSLILAPAFFLFCALNDEDRQEPLQSQDRSQTHSLGLGEQERAQSRAKISRSSR